MLGRAGLRRCLLQYGLSLFFGKGNFINYVQALKLSGFLVLYTLNYTQEATNAA